MSTKNLSAVEAARLGLEAAEAEYFRTQMECSRKVLQAKEHLREAEEEEKSLYVGEDTMPTSATTPAKSTGKRKSGGESTSSRSAKKPKVDQPAKKAVKASKTEAEAGGRRQGNTSSAKKGVPHGPGPKASTKGSKKRESDEAVFTDESDRGTGDGESMLKEKTPSVNSELKGRPLPGLQSIAAQQWGAMESVGDGPGLSAKVTKSAQDCLDSAGGQKGLRKGLQDVDANERPGQQGSNTSASDDVDSQPEPMDTDTDTHDHPQTVNAVPPKQPGSMGMSRQEHGSIVRLDMLEVNVDATMQDTEEEDEVDGGGACDVEVSDGAEPDKVRVEPIKMVDKLYFTSGIRENVFRQYFWQKVKGTSDDRAIHSSAPADHHGDFVWAELDEEEEVYLVKDSSLSHHDFIEVVGRDGQAGVFDAPGVKQNSQVMQEFIGAVSGQFAFRFCSSAALFSFVKLLQQHLSVDIGPGPLPVIKIEAFIFHGKAFEKMSDWAAKLGIMEHGYFEEALAHYREWMKAFDAFQCGSAKVKVEVAAVLCQPWRDFFALHGKSMSLRRPNAPNPIHLTNVGINFAPFNKCESRHIRNIIVALTVVSFQNRPLHKTKNLAAADVEILSKKGTRGYRVMEYYDPKEDVEKVFRKRAEKGAAFKGLRSKR